MDREREDLRDLCGGNVDARMFDDSALMTMKRMSLKATDMARES